MTGVQTCALPIYHLHEHFVHPAQVSRGRYLAPTAPGYSAEMKTASLATFAFPNGEAWQVEHPMVGGKKVGT